MRKEDVYETISTCLAFFCHENSFLLQTGAIYDSSSRPSTSTSHILAYPDPHRLSLLFMIISLSIFFDLSRPVYSPESDDYYALAKAAFALRDPVREGSSVWTVWTLLLMSRWCAYVDLPDERRVGAVLLGVVGKLALGVSDRCLFFVISF